MNNANSAVKTVLGRAWAADTAMRATWPEWAEYAATLMGKLGTWEIMYRNPDLRTYLEQRSPEFTEWARVKDMEAFFDDAERSGAADDDANEVTRYVRCCNCGSKLLDPIVYTERNEE